SPLTWSWCTPGRPWAGWTATYSEGSFRVFIPARPRRSSNHHGSFAHQGLDFARIHRHAAGDELAALVGDQRIVFDADAYVVELARHVVGGAHINARLDGQHHARLQVAPRAVLRGGRAAAIVAGIVHVEPQPVPGAVHVVAGIGA